MKPLLPRNRIHLPFMSNVTPDTKRHVDHISSGRHPQCPPAPMDPVSFLHLAFIRLW